MKVKVTPPYDGAGSWTTDCVWVAGKWRDEETLAEYPASWCEPISEITADDLAAAVRELRETVKAQDEEIARLMPLVIKTKRFERGDCPICHYNGPGYFQPDKHPCAKYYHEAEINPSLDEALNSGDGSYKP
jgi:hypothetical protein